MCRRKSKLQTSLKEIEDVRFKKIVLMTVYEIDLYRTSGRIGRLELDKTKTRMSFLPLKVNSLASSKMKRDRESSESYRRWYERPTLWLLTWLPPGLIGPNLLNCSSRSAGVAWRGMFLTQMERSSTECKVNSKNCLM